VEGRGQVQPGFNPGADVRSRGARQDHPMSISDYLIDGALVLLVLLQIKERPLSSRQLIRPLVIVGIAVVSYLHGIPTAGNDLVLTAVLALIGALIGLASGQTVIMRRGEQGEVLSRAGWSSAFFWVLGMGSRFAFVVWITHSGAGTIARFSTEHSITSSESWTVALLAMAVAEVVARTALLAIRKHHMQVAATLELA
jgi:hypothetical protein